MFIALGGQSGPGILVRSRIAFRDSFRLNRYVFHLRECILQLPA
jgi:hypothetical protein